jgi:hypothetical protein
VEKENILIISVLFLIFFEAGIPIKGNSPKLPGSSKKFGDTYKKTRFIR